MNYTLIAFYANIFGFAMAGISLFGWIVNTCRHHLPSNKIKALETMLQETEDVLKKVVEEGFLVHEYAQVADRRLAALKEDTRMLRSRAHTVTTLRQDYAEFLRGTSSSIGNAYDSLRKLRAEVITSSEERRRRLLEMGPLISSVTATPLPLHVNPETGILPPTTEIHEHTPSPSIHSTSESPDQAVEANPFGDSMQIDLNVRTTDVQT